MDDSTGYPIMDINYNLTYEPYTVTESTVYSSVSWDDPALDCNSCHDNPPETAYPEVQDSVGNSHQYINSDGYGNNHAWNMSFAPIMCRTCHYKTVTESATWTRDHDVTTYGDVPIADKAFHVNGSKDVVFDNVNNVTYNYSYSLAGTNYNPANKTCSSVPCHFDQPKPQWGKPYRYLLYRECDQCHHYGGSAWWPTYSPASMITKDPDAHLGDPQNCLDCHDAGHSGN
jgi:predicted CxxxxCH...CXXCH cytochrome family protein